MTTLQCKIFETKWKKMKQYLLKNNFVSNSFEWLQKNRKVSPRLYSLIVNLIERKNDNWKDRIST